MASMSRRDVLMSIAIIVLIAIAIYSITAITKAATDKLTSDHSDPPPQPVYAGTDDGGDYIMFLTEYNMNIQCKGEKISESDGNPTDKSPQTKIVTDDGGASVVLVKLYESQQLSVRQQQCTEWGPCWHEWHVVPYDNLNKKLNKESTPNVLFEFSLDTANLVRTKKDDFNKDALTRDPVVLPTDQCKARS